MKTLARKVPTHASDSLEYIYPIMGGHIFFQTLAAAVELNVFTVLKKHGPCNRARIAELLELEEKPVRILLLGLTNLKLLKKDRDLYQNTADSEELFVEGTPGSLVSIIKWQHHINYKAMFHFTDSLKANQNRGLKEIPGDEPTLYQRLSHDPRLEKIFQSAMQEISQRVNKYLPEFVDFSKYKYLVDVGGGNGTNVIEIAKRNPKIKAAVFDSPTVCKIAEKRFQEAGLDTQLSALSGQCFEDPFPKGADCLLFAHFFTIWSEKRDRELLKKCFNSLPVGGSVILFNMMQDDDETGPQSAAMGSPYFLTLATGEGMLYTWKEYESWMIEAGFNKVDIIRLPQDHGVIIGTKTNLHVVPTPQNVKD